MAKVTKNRRQGACLPPYLLLLLEALVLNLAAAKPMDRERINPLQLSTFKGYHYDYSLGNNGVYKFHYSLPTSSRQEQRDEKGEVKGSYSFVAPEGDEFDFKYEAGKKGFQVKSKALPTLPQDTDEVKKAKQEFFEAYKKALELVGSKENEGSNHGREEVDEEEEEDDEESSEESDEDDDDEESSEEDDDDDDEESEEDSDEEEDEEKEEGDEESTQGEEHNKNEDEEKKGKGEKGTDERELQSKGFGSKEPVKVATKNPSLTKTQTSKTSISKDSSSKTSVNETPVNKTPFSKTLVSKTPVSKTVVSKTPISKTLVSKTPVSKTLVRKTLVIEPQANQDYGSRKFKKPQFLSSVSPKKIDDSRSPVPSSTTFKRPIFITSLPPKRKTARESIGNYGTKVQPKKAYYYAK
ncbi:nuclear polyadenylated RNA-binding protein 3 [Hyalella azteca]|uniref:Nuclear polyadenylated RNA-binding protein 3 n=1 Tax=Hyalella azteca TaxID=294128 RepID=A0A8B7NM49_HYAAZ|nr:nuclear polyadenylated RNA-binding protein 3 [Hyalella azteca]